MDCSPPGSSVHGDSPGKKTRVLHALVLSCSPPGDLPNPGIESRSPASQVGSLPSESLGKLKNTGMGSLSLLQGIFAGQELNQSLLLCRWILHHLSYQGSPIHTAMCEANSHWNLLCSAKSSAWRSVVPRAVGWGQEEIYVHI